MGLIDSHTHTHLRSPEDLEAMAVAGVTGVVVCAFLPVRPSDAATLRDLFRWLLEEEVARLRAYGLHACVAVGVHPRCIPDRGLEQALDEVGRLLAARTAGALGEVGLETGSPSERELLAGQLALAHRLGVPAILHTPRANKPAMLEATLEIVAASGIEPARVVIDHLTPDLVAGVRARGLGAGLTIQPGKLTPADVVAVVARAGSAGIFVDSDLSHAPGDPLALPRVARALARAGVPAADLARVTGGNARALLSFPT